MAHFKSTAGPQFREALVVTERPLSLNPLINASDPAVADVGHLLYRSLLTLDDRSVPVPDLATSYAASTDGVTYTVILDSAYQWSDGRPVTTVDIVATIAFALASRSSNPTISAALAGVKVVAEKSTVTFTLPAPRASFAAVLTEIPILPLGGLPAPALRAISLHPDRPLATSGPYEVSSTSTTSILLTPNPHAATPPAITSYALRLFLSFGDAASAYAHGDVDALLATTPSERSKLLGVGGAWAHDITTFQFVDLLFNQRVPGLADAGVRHAISVALSRSAVVAGALHGSGGVVEPGPFPAGLRWLGTAGPEVSSPTAAAAALDGAGWRLGSDGVRKRGGVALSFTITVPDLDPLPVVGRELAGQLAGIGIRIQVDVEPPEVFLKAALTGRQYQLAVAEWFPAPDPDVSMFWRSNATPPHGFNVSSAPVDPFLDKALDSLATLGDTAARASAAAQVATYLAEDATAVFLYTPEVSFVYRIPMRDSAIPSSGSSAARYDEVASWQPG